MPIYEYESTDQAAGCPHCAGPFEVIQNMSEPPLTRCPECRGPVRRIMSRCRALVMEVNGEHSGIEAKIGDHEKDGRWSHAAELADKQSEKTGDSALKSRAMDNYKKAGYDV